jgi:hypothetical protein
LISQRQRAIVDRMIEDAATPFEDQKRAANELAGKIRQRLQLSLGFLAKTGEMFADEYRTSVILDFAPERILQVTLNGSFEFLEGFTAGEDDHYGASAAAQVTFRLTPDDIFGKQPATFSVAARWRKVEDLDAIFVVQGKLVLPLVDGIDLPISLTVASDPDLVAEQEIKGQIGFTIDTARLLWAIGS